MDNYNPTATTKKDKPFNRWPQKQAALDQLNHSIIIVYVNASQKGEAMLINSTEQQQNGDYQPIYIPQPQLLCFRVFSPVSILVFQLANQGGQQCHSAPKYWNTSKISKLYRDTVIVQFPLQQSITGTGTHTATHTHKQIPKVLV